jgi:hypothetical protein
MWAVGYRYTNGSDAIAAAKRANSRRRSDMRTTLYIVTFRSSFILNKDVGELPAGSYQIEIDEEEIPSRDRQAFRRTAIYFHVGHSGSTRMFVISPNDLDSALERDREKTIDQAAAADLEKCR